MSVQVLMWTGMGIGLEEAVHILKAMAGTDRRSR